MAGRKIVDEREARAMLARVARSRSEPASWGRAHGIDGRSLNAWRNILERKRGRRPVARPPRRRVEKSIQLVELVPSTLPTGPMLARYSLKIGEVAIEFGDDARADTLRRVLEVLRSC